MSHYLLVERFAKVFSSRSKRCATMFSVKGLKRSFGQKASAIDALQNSIGLWPGFVRGVGNIIHPSLVNDSERLKWGGDFCCTQSNHEVLAISFVKFWSNLEACQRKLESLSKNTITCCSRKSQSKTSCPRER